jgi:hypothetical protein
MVAFISSDLEFILKQIIIAERNAAGEALIDILPNLQVPFGVRTVDGTDNKLVAGQSEFGAADNLLPRMQTAAPWQGSRGPWMCDGDGRNSNWSRGRVGMATTDCEQPLANSRDRAKAMGFVTWSHANGK